LEIYFVHTSTTYTAMHLDRWKGPHEVPLSACRIPQTPSWGFFMNIASIRSSLKQ
jgi:hypothetical protein